MRTFRETLFEKRLLYFGIACLGWGGSECLPGWLVHFLAQFGIVKKIDGVLVHILIAGRIQTLFSFLLSQCPSETKKIGPGKSVTRSPFDRGAVGQTLFVQ